MEAETKEDEPVLGQGTSVGRQARSNLGNGGLSSGGGFGPRTGNCDLKPVD